MSLEDLVVRGEVISIAAGAVVPRNNVLQLRKITEQTHAQDVHSTFTDKHDQSRSREGASHGQLPRLIRCSEDGSPNCDQGVPLRHCSLQSVATQVFATAVLNQV